MQNVSVYPWQTWISWGDKRNIIGRIELFFVEGKLLCLEE